MDKTGRFIIDEDDNSVIRCAARRPGARLGLTAANSRTCVPRWCAFGDGSCGVARVQGCDTLWLALDHVLSDPARVLLQGVAVVTALTVVAVTAGPCVRALLQGVRTHHHSEAFAWSPRATGRAST